MAEGLLRHDAGDTFELESAGTTPGIVRPEAIKAMQEVGIDISCGCHTGLKSRISTVSVGL
ncbi:MAG: hypothetical protein JO061_13055 [Acidobacteriaceae bacterium]|nr:hypothetical protein [Acidobacteriaceae bacterium]